ncbi:MAG: hypothetical protein AAF830_07880 [Pseudomonadota bacterium]
MMITAALASAALLHPADGPEQYQIRYETVERQGRDKRIVKMTFDLGVSDDVVEMGEGQVYFRVKLSGEETQRTAAFDICAAGSDPCTVISSPSISFEQGKRASINVRPSKDSDSPFEKLKILIKPTH